MNENTEDKIMYIVSDNIGHFFDDVIFKSEDDANKAIFELAKRKYGDGFKMVDEHDETIRIINDYWCGDFSMEEAEEKIEKHIKNEKLEITFDDVMSSAVFYDFIGCFYVKEMKVVDDMDRLIKNINNLQSEEI
jgi:hypothetical protein